MTVQLWILYLIAAIGLSLTPGPNGLLALTHGARFGFRPAMATIAGGGAGFFLLIAISLAGMGALLVASEWAFMIAKWAGGAYLVYLGVRLWQAPAPLARPGGQIGHSCAVRPTRLFAEGFLVSISNPKAILFFAAFLPQFMTPGASYVTQLAVFGGTFVMIEIVYELMLASLAYRIAPWLTRYGRTFNRITGSMFIGIGAILATARR